VLRTAKKVRTKGKKKKKNRDVNWGAGRIKIHTGSTSVYAVGAVTKKRAWHLASQKASTQKAPHGMTRKMK